MAMVISPRSKIVTVCLLIGIILLLALILTVISIWHEDSDNSPNSGSEVVSSRLQQFTGYTAVKHGLLQTLQIFPGHPQDLVRCENDNDDINDYIDNVAANQQVKSDRIFSEDEVKSLNSDIFLIQKLMDKFRGLGERLKRLESGWTEERRAWKDDRNKLLQKIDKLEKKIIELTIDGGTEEKTRVWKEEEREEEGKPPSDEKCKEESEERRWKESSRREG